MRLVFVALLAGLAWGCAANKAGRPDSMVGEAKALSNPPPSRAREAAKPAVAPDLGVCGKVLLVNSVLRFVVMDFPIRRMPALEQRLNIYHNGQKVGEVKVTGPARDTTIAGDITTGAAQAGDEVRDD